MSGISRPLQRAQGDLSGALQQYRASLKVAEKLAEQDKSNAGWQRGLSVSLVNIGDVLRDQGDLSGALQQYRASSEIFKKLAKQDAGNTSWQRDVSVSLGRIGDVLRVVVK